jgi:hypothetical protein
MTQILWRAPTALAPKASRVESRFIRAVVSRTNGAVCPLTVIAQHANAGGSSNKRRPSGADLTIELEEATEGTAIPGDERLHTR